jgi:uncharacterized membrane protein
MPTENVRTHLLNGLLLVWLWAFSILRWPDLPDKIPMHFRLSGAPDAWEARSWTSWFALPLSGLGITALMYLSAWMAKRFPRAVNVPAKDLYVSLPPASRAPILARVQNLVYRIAALISLQFILFQVGTYQVATGKSPVLPLYVRVSSPALVGLILLLTISDVVRIRGMVVRAAQGLTGGHSG